jgi:hypothetical protein
MFQSIRSKIANSTLINGLPFCRGLLIIPLVFIGLGLCPAARAVTPAPDGGYPGGNTAEGTNALFSLTTGVNNAGLGFQALYRDTTGSNNTGTGFRALFSNINGANNTASGMQSLYGNRDGVNNTASGFQSLFANVNGDRNTAFGSQALFTGNGDNNTAIGFQALMRNTSQVNTAIGTQTLSSNTNGSFNTAVGYQADLHSNGFSNDAFGYRALYNVTTGSYNVGAGVQTLFNLVSGNYNTAIGNGAGQNLTGSGNVCIGQGIYGIAGENNTTRIRNIYSSVASARVVYVNADNKIGTLASSRRYKEDIKPMEKASESILTLKPVTFRYKPEFDGSRAPMFGLIAEEVEKINPDLVSRNEKGEVETVRYDAINAMLLNEFLKEHQSVQTLKSTVEKQETIIAQQQKGLDVLTAQLKEQASQIQKVSARLEVSKPAPQVVDNK